jgi:hypothetical protein
VIVWGGFSCDSKMALTLLPGLLNAIRYHDELVMNCILPRIQVHSTCNMKLVQDNASVYTARVTREALQELGIPVMDWPANSPDFNIIEHASDMLGRSLEQHEPPFHTIAQLQQAILNTWEDIPIENCNI